MPHQFTLYHYWRSSCSWRLRWALAYKGLSYQSVTVNLLKAEQKNDSFAKLNPAKFVPALMIDGEPFGESVPLIEWLEEQYPTPALLPKDPRSRLIVRQLTSTIASGIQPIQNLGVQSMFSQDPSEKARWAQHWICRGLETYEALVEKHAGSFSFGGALTLADVCLVPQVYNAHRFAVDMSAYPIIDRIYRHCLTLPSCQASHPDVQPGATP